MMKKILILIFLIFFQHGYSQQSVVYAPPPFSQTQPNLQVNAKISGSIDDIVSLSYEHAFLNKENQTYSVIVEYSFNGKPELLEIFVNGEKTEPEITSMDRFYASYRLRLNLEPDKEVTVVSKIKSKYSSGQPYEPFGGGAGLWRNIYSFNNPLNFYIEGIGMPILGKISGEIKLPENAKRVECSGCEYDASKNAVVVNQSQNLYFSFSFQIKKAPPLKAVLFYILMLSAAFGYILIKRREKV